MEFRGRRRVYSEQAQPHPAKPGRLRLRPGQAGLLGEVPDWAAETEYFRALVADGKIVPTGKRDAETQAAAEKKVKTRRGREVMEA